MSRDVDLKQEIHVNIQSKHFFSSRRLSKDLKIRIRVYKTVTLSVVVYGSETYSLTLGEKCRLRLFENRVLRQVIGPKKNENEEKRRLHNEKLHGSYRSPDTFRLIISRILRWTGHVARMEEVGVVSKL